MTGNHGIMEVEHREGGLAGPVKDQLRRNQLQLVLRGIHAVLADRDVAPTDTNLGRLSPSEGVTGLSEGAQVFHE